MAITGAKTLPVTRNSRRRASAAFTLLEVVLALTILSLLLGTVFALVSGSMNAASDTQATQQEDRAQRAFSELCRRAFDTLPTGAMLELKVIETNPLVQELTLLGAPGAFRVGEAPASIYPTVLGLRRLDDVTKNDWMLRFARRGAKDNPIEPPGFVPAFTRQDLLLEEKPAEGALFAEPPKMHPLIPIDEHGRFWMELGPAVASLEWRFYDPGKKLWIETSPPVRPPLVQLTMLPPGHRTPIRYVYAIRA